MSKVIYTDLAKYDLLEIGDYILTTLKSPTAALRTTDGILAAADRLRFFPKRHPTLKDSLPERPNLRMTAFKNYNVFYEYDSSADVVYIIRVLYNRMNWQQILENKR